MLKHMPFIPHQEQILQVDKRGWSAGLKVSNAFVGRDDFYLQQVITISNGMIAILFHIGCG